MALTFHDAREIMKDGQRSGVWITPGCSLAAVKTELTQRGFALTPREENELRLLVAQVGGHS